MYEETSYTIDLLTFSAHIVKSLKAQINALKLMMNKDYLVFMNITLFNDLIKNLQVLSVLNMSLLLYPEEEWDMPTNYSGNS